jgi:Tol biopolymer transport system component
MAWSPDGSMLMYLTAGVIHVVNADGTGGHALVTASTDDATWSPDSRSLAFGYHGTWSIPADGSGAQQPLNSAQGSSPGWSPDGKTIAADNGAQILLIPVDGSAVRIVASPACLPRCASNQTYNHPRWSSDGKTIAALVGDGMFVVGADSTGFHQLVPDQGLSEAPLPEMSPDGSLIAYLAPWGGLGGGGSIYTTSMDGTSQSHIATSGSVDLLRWAR